jgi:hypothetical protein
MRQHPAPQRREGCDDAQAGWCYRADADTRREPSSGDEANPGDSESAYLHRAHRLPSRTIPAARCRPGATINHQLNPGKPPALPEVVDYSIGKSDEPKYNSQVKQPRMVTRSASGIRRGISETPPEHNRRRTRRGSRNGVRWKNDKCRWRKRQPSAAVRQSPRVTRLTWTITEWGQRAVRREQRSETKSLALPVPPNSRPGHWRSPAPAWPRPGR